MCVCVSRHDNDDDDDADDDHGRHIDDAHRVGGEVDPHPPTPAPSRPRHPTQPTPQSREGLNPCSFRRTLE